MDKYGINNVRGGSFVSITLDGSVLSTLKQMDSASVIVAPMAAQGKGLFPLHKSTHPCE